MNAKPDDQSAIRQAIERVQREAESLSQAVDTDAIRARLLAVRGAVIDAYDLTHAIEDYTRGEALRELETRLQQRVGLEEEHL